MKKSFLFKKLQNHPMQKIMNSLNCIMLKLVFVVTPFVMSSNMLGSELIKNLKIGYTKEEIMEKAARYKWEKANVLTFVILNKLKSIQVNDGFKGEFGFKWFKRGVRKAVWKIDKTILDIYERNIWFSNKDDDKDIQKLVQIHEKIKKFTLNNKIQTILTEQIKPLMSGLINGDGANALYAICNQEKCENLDIDIMLENGGDNFDLIWNIFKISEHYEHVHKHRNLLLYAFLKLSTKFKALSVMDIICHDWSKFIFEFSLGYTWKWMHNKPGCVQTPFIESLVLFLGVENFDYLKIHFENIWDEAWKLHYKSEEHHPEYFFIDEESTSRDSSGIVRVGNKNNMSEGGLEESFLDMASMSLMRIFDPKVFLETVESLNYIVFDVKFLERYNLDDAKKIISKILEIIYKDGLENLLEDAKIKYKGFMQLRSEVSLL
jgi:hypothetical protein